MELQARLKDGNDEWKNAFEVLKVVDEESGGVMLELYGFTRASTVQQLYSGNAWSYTWESLPTSVNGDSVEYRAVELMVEKDGDISTISGNSSASVPNDTSDSSNELYSGTVHSYTTYQTADPTGDSDGEYKTTITNKLQKTNLAVTKIWDDRNNAWNTRPLASGESGNWEVTFYLQCSADDGSTWQWMNKGGAPSDERMDNTVSYTMQGSGNDPVKAVFEHLPKYNDSGDELQYRAVEQVPVGYKVAGATNVESESSGSNNDLVTVDSGVTVADDSAPTEDSGEPADAIQTFKNQLITINLSGTKSGKTTVPV